MGLLRTIFAISVVCAHSPWHDHLVFVGGRNAVQLFYMISGFLISHVMGANAVYRDPWRFYLSRALRLYPIYYAVAFLSLAFSVYANNLSEIYINIPVAACGLLIFSNLFLFGQDWVMFSRISNGRLAFATDFRKSDILLYKGLLIPQAWTLGLELSFYALAPFILRSRRIIFLLLGLSLLIRVCLFAAGLGKSDPWIYRFFPAELALFLLGVLSNWYLLPAWKRLISLYGLKRAPMLGTYLVVCMCLLYFLIPAKEAVKTPALFAAFLVFLPLTFLYQSMSGVDKAIGELKLSHLYRSRAWHRLY